MSAPVLLSRCLGRLGSTSTLSSCSNAVCSNSFCWMLYAVPCLPSQFTAESIVVVAPLVYRSLRSCTFSFGSFSFGSFSCGSFSFGASRLVWFTGATGGTRGQGRVACGLFGRRCGRLVCVQLLLYNPCTGKETPTQTKKKTQIRNQAPPRPQAAAPPSGRRLRGRSRWAVVLGRASKCGLRWSPSPHCGMWPRCDRWLM